MPVRDANLVVRATTDGALAYGAAGADLPAGGLDIEGTALQGMALHVIIPDTMTGSVVLQINVHASTASTAATTDTIVASRSGMTYGAEYIIPFSTHKRSVIFDFLATGNTSGSFSIVLAWVTLQFGQDWTRTVEFH